MDTQNKRSSAGVDDILEELRHRGGPATTKGTGAKSGSVDDILASLGMEAKRPPKRAVPPAAKPAGQAAAPPPQPFPPKAAPAPPTAAQAPRAGLFEAPAKPAPDMFGQDAPAAPAAKPVPAAGLFDGAEPAAPKPAAPTQDHTIVAPAVRGGKFSNSSASIWDIETGQTQQLPRMGKAAALEKVDPDKFAGETELLSWFTEEEGLSRKEQKRAEKLEKKQLAAQLKEEKRRTKYAPEEDDFEEPEEEGPAGDVAALAFERPAAPGAGGDGPDLFFSGGAADKAKDAATPAAPPTAPSTPAAPTGDLFATRSLEVLSDVELPSPAPAGPRGGLFGPPDTGEAPARTPPDDVFDTQSYDLNETDLPRVPTAAFTQEFDSPEDGPAADNANKSLFVDEMVDDRFREFFSETMLVEKGDAPPDPKGRRKKRRGRTAILTGEFSKLAEMAQQAELDEEKAEEDGFDDYNHPQDAAAIEGDIASLCSTLTRRTIGTLVIGVLLLWMGFGFGEGGLWLPEFASFTHNPMVFAIIYLVLIVGALVVNFTTVASGIAGLGAEPTVDSSPALAGVAALLQGVVLLVQVITQQAASAILYGALAALLLAFNALGKRIRAGSILRNFQLASAGYDHSAAYILDSQNDIAFNITRGLEEEEPVLLVSRPTALVKGFLRQSFSPRGSDRTGRVIAWVLLAFSLAGAGMSFFFTQDLFVAISCFAGVLCIGTPLSSSLVSAIPSTLLQRGTARVGAVVPGWSAIEELGQVNVVMASASDIFPPSAVSLRGIKTFEKERIDLAILYAASVLIEGCGTLRDVFTGVIQGKTDMLYKVESLSCEPGRGFTAWVENSRVVVGSREMLQRHDIDPPPIEIELKHVPAGHMPVYLAVSGKLFAMFIVGYGANPEVQETLDGLVRSGVSLLIQSDDMNVTDELVERAYDLPHGTVKVLGRKDLDILEPLTGYLPESEGVMTHVGTFSSFIGGMRAAASCAVAERMSSIVQIASVALITLLCMLLIFSGGGVLSLSVLIGLLYQVGWSLLSSLLPFARKY